MLHPLCAGRVVIDSAVPVGGAKAARSRPPSEARHLASRVHGPNSRTQVRISLVTPLI
jgi:hypothetical protein